MALVRSSEEDVYYRIDSMTVVVEEKEGVSDEAFFEDLFGMVIGDG